MWSTATSTSPGRSMNVSPSGVANSSVPDSVITNCGSGSGCQSYEECAGVSLKWMATTSVRSFSSIVPSCTCDALSGPVYSLYALILFYLLRVYLPHDYGLLAARYASGAKSLVMAVRRADLSPEHAVVDRGVKQQQREDEKAFSPEHECKTRLRRRCFVDGEDEGNDVRPERDRQRAEGREEDQDDHGKGQFIAAVANAEREHGDAKRADHREDEQIRTLQPAAQHPQILGEGIGEHHNEKYEQADRQIRHE